MFGDMSLFLGAVDDQGTVWYRLLSSTHHIQLLASKAQDAVYCSAYEAIYILTGNFGAIAILLLLFLYVLFINSGW